MNRKFSSAPVFLCTSALFASVLVLLCSSVLIASPALAAEIETDDGTATLRGLEGIFANAVSAILGLAGIVTFVMLLVGGFQYITSAGDAAKVEQARKTLTFAVLGLVFVSISFLILKLIENFTGVPITVFKVFQE